jgi:hypothetical protein
VIKEACKQRGLWLAWIGTALLVMCVAHGNFETTDAGFTMHAARSLWHRGDSALLTKEQGGELIGEQLGASYIIDSEREGGRKSGKIGVNGRAYVWYPMGHVFLMTPFVPLGDAVGALLPDADAKLQQAASPFMQSYVEGHPVVTQGLISMLVPSLSFATSIMLLFAIARLLGAGPRDAAWTVFIIGFCTQAFALGREQLSDGPGLMLLLAAMLPVLRLHIGKQGRWTSVVAGMMAGASVLLRYQTAIAVGAFAIVILLACRRQKRFRDFWMYCAGGAPLLVVFLLTNYLRFGDPLVTGYPEIGDWFNASPVAGVTKLFFGAGRGIMWFSPILWLAIPYALLRRSNLRLRWLAWSLFLPPVLIFMKAQGWQGGQAWAIRYLTPAVVGLLVIVLPQMKPWHSWPRLCRLLVAIGWFVSLTSVLAPVRGQLQLANQAVAADRSQALSQGLITAQQAQVDAADYGGWHPDFTPLVANWLYALHSREGFFEDENGMPRHHVGAGIRPVYGVNPVSPKRDRVPSHWADRRGRHVWWRFWGDLYGVEGWLLVLPMGALGALLAYMGWSKLMQESESSLVAESASSVAG